MLIYVIHYFSTNCGKTGNYFMFADDVLVGTVTFDNYVTYKSCPDNE